MTTLRTLATAFGLMLLNCIAVQKAVGQETRCSSFRRLL